MYMRTHEIKWRKLLILLNFSGQKATVKTGLDTKKAKLLITNYGGKSSTTEVRPYEASIFKL